MQTESESKTVQASNEINENRLFFSDSDSSDKVRSDVARHTFRIECHLYVI